MDVNTDGISPDLLKIIDKVYLSKSVINTGRFLNLSIVFIVINTGMRCAKMPPLDNFCKPDKYFWWVPLNYVVSPTSSWVEVGSVTIPFSHVNSSKITM